MIETLLSRADYFKDSEYSDKVEIAFNLYNSGRIVESQKVLEELPSDRELFDTLLAELQGKSVYTTLNRISEGKANKTRRLIGYSSLLTHAAIMSEKKSEYKLLYEIILKKIYENL